MEIRSLVCFLAVVEHGGISRAARDLHMTQPSLSYAIKQLEREVRGELFLRSSKGTRLTPAGESLVGPARQVLRELQIASDNVRAALNLEGGAVDVAAVPAVAHEPLAEIIGAFVKQHPKVTVRVRDPEDTSDPSALVRDGSCEVGLAESPDGAELVAHLLAISDMMVVMPPGSRPVQGALKWEDLAPLSFVTTRPNRSVSRGHLERVFAEIGRDLRVAVETDHRSSTSYLVLAGAGCALLRRSTAERLQSQGAIAVPLDPPIERPLYLLHRADSLSPAARSFVEVARRHTRALDHDGVPT